jgi:RND family efflux transporter MFP subunit
MILLLLFVLILSGCAAATDSGVETPLEGAGVAAAAARIAIDAARTEKTEIDRTLEAVGNLGPYEEVTVTNQVEGLVAKLFVDLGDAVTSGQVLAQLDTRELELALHQQTAALQQELARLGVTDPNTPIDEAGTSQVRQAEAALAEARLRRDRSRQLVEEGVLPRQQLDEHEAKYEIAEAALKSARESVRNIKATIAARKAAVDLAQKKLADTKIVAPMTGLVRERLVSEGSYLKANSPIVTLVQNNPLRLRVEIPETAIELMRPGRPVRLSVDSLPARSFEGRVTRTSPSVDQASRTLKLEALVDNPGGVLLPGMFARVTLSTGRKETVLAVPAGAIFQFAGLEKVFVVEDGKVSERIVRSGTRIDGRTEIVEGVREGEIVAVSNLGSLQQGREVSIR